MAVKYLFYSTQQLEFRRNIEKKIGAIFSPGQVIVNGVKQPFTEKSGKNTSRWSDAKLVISGEESTLKIISEPGE